MGSWGLDRVGWTGDIPVLAMETKSADSLRRSLQAGKLITLPKVTSIANSLDCGSVTASF